MSFEWSARTGELLVCESVTGTHVEVQPPASEESLSLEGAASLSFLDGAALPDTSALDFDASQDLAARMPGVISPSLSSSCAVLSMGATPSSSRRRLSDICSRDALNAG
jgi:hypothetical protein